METEVVFNSCNFLPPLIEISLKITCHLRNIIMLPCFPHEYRTEKNGRKVAIQTNYIFHSLLIYCSLSIQENLRKVVVVFTETKKFCF